MLLLFAAAHAAPTFVIDVTSPRYRNLIPSLSPPRAYVEVCFKGGQQLHDTHAALDPTVGGNCEPGDVGFLIELAPRSTKRWPDARAACTADGLRLPEVFELGYACNNAVTLGYVSATEVVGWMSNDFTMDNVSGPRVPTMSGNGTCYDWNWTPIFSSSNGSQFLCAM